MAEFMTPEEMTAAYSAASKKAENEIKQLGAVTAETKNALKTAEAGLKDYTQNLQKSLSALGTSVKRTIGSMAESAKGAKQYNDAIEKGADYLSTVLSARGPIGIAAGMIVKASGAYVKAVNKQADALYKSYQDISRAGVTGAGGITELYGTMQKFGYGIKELDQLTAILQENSTNLASLSGTAVDGAQTFGNISKEIRDSELGVRLQNMGVSVDGMNKGIAGYLRIQTLTGQGQLQTQEELRKGAEAYVYEQERLTKLTGLNADEQNKIREQALSEERFGAHIADLKQKAADALARGDKDAADKLNAQAEKEQKINAYLISKNAKDLAQGFRNVSTGYLNDPEAVKFLNTLPDTTKGIRANADMGEIMNTMSKEANTNFRNTVELRKAGAGERSYIKGADLQAISNLEDFNKSAARADKQLESTDAATESMTGLGIKQRETRDDLQNLLQVGIRPVTALMSGLATAISKVSGGASAVATGVTGGAGGTSGAKQTAPAGTQAAPKAAPGAPAPSAPGGPATSTGGASLSGNLSGVDQRLVGALTAAADEYKSLTGKAVTVTSGLRDSAKQQQLYDAYKSGRSKFPAAKPGTSKHEQGLAVDINQSDADAMDSMGLLRKHGLARPVPKDPVHIQGFAGGGIASGPQSGYQTMLHGTEAVVPLPDGKSIPVEFPNIMSGLSDETNLIAQQLAKMDDIMRVMQNQISVSNKILQRSS
jgi:hypothetical protein